MNSWWAWTSQKVPFQNKTKTQRARTCGLLVEFLLSEWKPSLIPRNENKKVLIINLFSPKRRLCPLFPRLSEVPSPTSSTVKPVSQIWLLIFHWCSHLTTPEPTDWRADPGGSPVAEPLGNLHFSTVSGAWDSLLTNRRMSRGRDLADRKPRISCLWSNQKRDNLHPGLTYSEDPFDTGHRPYLKEEAKARGEHSCLSWKTHTLLLQKTVSGAEAPIYQFSCWFWPTISMHLEDQKLQLSFSLLATKSWIGALAQRYLDFWPTETVCCF